ncbi:MAG: hypothetical protein IJA71_10895 [Clostridia bacterium]|nr:hypothetical protein [Clostridia bacterium]
MILAKEVSPLSFVAATEYHTPGEKAMFHVKRVGELFCFFPLFLFGLKGKSGGKREMQEGVKLFVQSNTPS